MAEVFTQADRLLVLETTLDFDTLLITNFSASESMSGLFRYEVNMVAEHAKASSVVPEDLIGQKFTVGVSLTNHYDAAPRRYFNGIVSRFVQGHRDRRFVHYRAELVPWLWLLTLHSDCRVFQGKSVPEIVETLFGDSGMSDYKFSLKKPYTKLDYCVQYRESVFNFISRLLEQEGITYFWEHEEKKHTLVFSDMPSTHKPCPNQPSAVYIQEGGWQEFDNPVTSWEIKSELRPGKFSARDFHMQMPSSTLEKNEPTKIPLANNTKLEVYDYPGEYAARFNAKGRKGEVEGEGTKLVKVRMEEFEARQKECFGTSLCRGFIPGFNFKLEQHYSKKVNSKYVLTSVQHTAVQTPWYVAEEQSSMGEPYQNSFSCIPDDVPYRPPRNTPKPIVQGPQTAIVVGPKGEEIHVDEFGRVKAQFHWDRLGKKDETSSCWMRVSQSYAGKGWGMVCVPRIGQEVVIDFLEGDPDQPLITGRVYNAESMPPYGLPGAGMVSGLKSNSTPGGGGYNEMSMNDTKGKELITVHAQYDMDTTVEHDDRQTVHNNRTITVDGTHTETIDKETKITILTGNSTFDVQTGTHTHHVKANVIETYEANQTTTVTNVVTIDAGDEITLHTGSSNMTMKKDGSIRIDGKDITIIGTNEIKLGVGSQTITLNNQEVATAGAAIKSSAVGVHEISGALVKIN